LLFLGACVTYKSMRNLKYDAAIQAFIETPVFTAAEARAAGIPSRMLAHFCKKGVIERVTRGVYKGSQAKIKIDFQWEDLALVAMGIPNGVICLVSALCYYGLTDQIMRQFWIAIPHASKSPQRPKTKIVRMRNIELGQTEIQLGSARLKIFDKERTVVDSFRYLSKEIAIKSLQAYLRQTGSSKPDLNKLLKYAKTLRVDINPFIMALTT
jgi:predicted transcriptional regulator of viral defense system